MIIDIKDFYLMTPMARYDYMLLKLADLPDDVIEQYNLRDRVTKEGYVYPKIGQGMYGLKQAGILAQQKLKNRLNKEGYHQSKLTPGVWTHTTCLI